MPQRVTFGHKMSLMSFLLLDICLIIQNNLITIKCPVFIYLYSTFLVIMTTIALNKSNLDTLTDCFNICYIIFLVCVSLIHPTHTWQHSCQEPNQEQIAKLFGNIVSSAFRVMVRLFSCSRWFVIAQLSCYRLSAPEQLDDPDTPYYFHFEYLICK